MSGPSHSTTISVLSLTWAIEMAMTEWEPYYFRARKNKGNLRELCIYISGTKGRAERSRPKSVRGRAQLLFSLFPPVLLLKNSVEEDDPNPDADAVASVSFLFPDSLV
ncbi:hypothetical protein SLEP1_g6801 [Rubroshorea leprosula]|uniref:Uncharacterized protein n=1 Tax=Rubroshorea leprosula TaxID=152421 RepID=A0AAV5HWD9_9ROSI|nr:hypothetical protein SLEP1_g6801 [Rubroshorea leprosula]